MPEVNTDNYVDPFGGEGHVETPVPEPVEVVAESVESPEVVQDNVQEQDGERKHRPGRSEREREKTRLAREEAARLREELEALKRGIEPPKQPSGVPTIEQFETWEEYETALRSHFIEEGKRVAKEEYQKGQATQKQKEFQETITRKIETFREAAPDWDDINDDFRETVEEVYKDAPHTCDALGIAIGESDLTANLMYHFGKHPAELKRLVSMSPYAALRELGKIEATLSVAPKNPVVPLQTKAPAPPRPLSGTSSAAPIKDRTDTYITIFG